MGMLSVGSQELSFEQIAKTAASREFRLVVEYDRPEGEGSGTTEIDLDVARRQEATKEAISSALRDWYDGSPATTIRSFEVVERIDCRRGESVGTTGDSRSDRTGGAETQSEAALTGDTADGGATEVESEIGSIDGPAPGVDADALSEGDVVAYYVEGPHSSVYGYVAEGIVETVPPWTRGVPGKGEVIQDKAVVDVGDRTREIPLAWIIGTTADDAVADAVDRQYPA